MFAWVSLLALGVAFLDALSQTLDWPLAHDAPLMQYIAWRILEGDVPYRDFLDMNFPLTYLLHVLGTLVFGYSDFGFRCFDITALALIGAGIFRYCRTAGLFTAAAATLFFCCYHLAMGNINEGQRDYLLCAFLIWALYNVARVVETGSRGHAFLAGVLLACCLWMKPGCLLFIALMGMYLAIKRRWGAFLPLFWGGLAVTAPLMGWYAVMGVLDDFFLYLVHFLLPTYSTLGVVTLKLNLYYVAIGYLGIYFPMILLPATPSDRSNLLGLGLIFGVAHFLFQGKGWGYHLYPALLFGTVAMLYRLEENLRGQRPYQTVLAGLMLSWICYLMGPSYALRPEVLQPLEMEAAQGMVADLEALAPNGESVQVIDTTTGALNALYRLKRKNATRYLYDFMLFMDSDDPMVLGLQQDFLARMLEKMPYIILVTQQSWPDLTQEYDRLAAFPAFAGFLDRNYTLYAEQYLYRVYVRK